MNSPKSPAQTKRSEHWKRTWWVGLAFAIAIMIGYVWKGNDPGAGMVTLTLGCLGIAAGWQGVKRFTEWKPKELAEADAIRNGNGCADKREEDEYGAEFTP